MPSFRESYAHLADGRGVYYSEEGEGPPMLFIHGAFDSAEFARPMINVLRDRFHCIALDRIGWHRSGVLDRTTTLEEQVEGIAVVHNACTSEPAWVFSHSSGGNFAVAYAVFHSDRVRGLALMEPPLFAVFPPETRPPGVAAMMDRIVPRLRKDQLDEAAHEFRRIHRGEMSPEDQVQPLSPEGRQRWEAFAKDQLLVVSWAPSPSQWAQLTQPVLIIKGDRTAAPWYRECAARMMELLPNSTMVILRELDHGAHMQAPGVLAKATVEFIDRAAASASKDSPATRGTSVDW